MGFAMTLVLGAALGAMGTWTFLRRQSNSAGAETVDATSWSGTEDSATASATEAPTTEAEVTE